MPVDNTMIILLCAILFVAFLIVFIIGKVGIIKKWDAAIIFWRQAFGLYFVYIFTLLTITVLARGPRGEDLPDIFIPFYDIYFIIKNGYPWYYDNIIILNVVNIVMFIPYGILAREVTHNKILIPLLTGIAVSLTIEIIQMLTDRGIFDINDIIYNALGALAGCGIYALCGAIWRKKSKKD